MTKNAKMQEISNPSLTARAAQASKIGENIQRLQELRKFRWILENPNKIPELDKAGSNSRGYSPTLLGFCDFLANASTNGDRKYFAARAGRDEFVSVETESERGYATILVANSEKTTAAPRVIFSNRIPEGLLETVPDMRSESFPEKAVAALAEVLGQPKVRKELAKALEAERKELVRKFNDVRAVADYAIAEAYKFADEIRKLKA